MQKINERVLIKKIMGVIVTIVLFLIGYVFVSSQIRLSNQRVPEVVGEKNDTALVSSLREKLSLSLKATVEIKDKEGDYMWGNAGEPEGSGFYWVATKNDDEWSVALTGNGIPDCEDVAAIPVGIFNGKFDTCYKGSSLIERK